MAFSMQDALILLSSLSFLHRHNLYNAIVSVSNVRSFAILLISSVELDRSLSFNYIVIYLPSCVSVCVNVGK